MIRMTTDDEGDGAESEIAESEGLGRGGDGDGHHLGGSREDSLVMSACPWMEFLGSKLEKWVSSLLHFFQQHQIETGLQ